MRCFFSWITLSSCRLLPTCYVSSFFHRASSVGCFLLALSVAVSSDAFANVTLYCRELRSGFSDKTPYDRKWVTWEEGGSGGLQADYRVYPQLVDMQHSSATGGFVYWPHGYGRSQTPVLYTVTTVSALNIVVPDAYTDQIPNIQNTLLNDTTLPPPQRSAIQSISATFDSDGTPVIDIKTYGYGHISGNGVATGDGNGNIVLSYPDSTGFVSGYEPNIEGGYSQVWYDKSIPLNGYATRLDSISGKDSSSLSYDSDTGLYSFSSPDYSQVLSLIQSDIHRLTKKELILDGIHLEIPAPEVTVNPEITVEPQVTVNPTVTVTPDVTVNVTNPGSSLTVSEIAQGVSEGISTSPFYIEGGSIQSEVKSMNKRQQTISTNLIAISSYFHDTPSSDLDLSASNLTQEEQSLLAVPQQWNTQIPLIGDFANVAFGAFLGNIPDPGRQLCPLNLEVLGFNMVIDFTPYSTYITWFRAFVLMAEFIWFLDCIWRSVVKVLAV